MRYVILLLVAINVGYLGWQVFLNNPDEPAEHSLPPLPADVRRLVTLEESKTRQLPSRQIRKIEVLTATKPPGAVLTPSCQALGPFLAASNLGAFEKRLDRLGLTTEPQTRYVREQVGYTVRLPSMEYEEALQIKRRLDKENIEANFVGRGNVLSLGVFRNSSLAQKTLERARALGLDAHLEPGYAKRSTYWLVFQKRDKQHRGLKSLTRKNRDLRVEDMVCP